MNDIFSDMQWWKRSKEKGWQEGSDQSRGSLEEDFTLFLGLAGNHLLDFLAMSIRTTTHVSHYTRNFTFLLLTLTAILWGSINLVSQMRKQAQRSFVPLLVQQLEMVTEMGLEFQLFWSQSTFHETMPAHKITKSHFIFEGLSTLG